VTGELNEQASLLPRVVLPPIGDEQAVRQKTAAKNNTDVNDLFIAFSPIGK
jgi:hypothetical protein